ncbi:retrovirus-related pol polyprotein from transposon TNT 1-94 [Tanacetum coccineum]
MSGTVPPIPPPLGTSSGNPNKRLEGIIISCLPNDVMKSVIKCKTAKEMWNDLILAHEGPSNIRDTKIAALRLKFNAFKSLEGEKVNGTFTRLKCLLNDLENNGVIIPQAEVNATFVNNLPRKWLSMNETQRANNSIKNDCLATLYGKYNYEKDVEEDQRTNNEFMADLNAEKPIDKSKETCFACGKTGHFQKDYPSNKTSTPSYTSSNNPFNKPKPYTPPFNQTSSQNTSNHQKDYTGKYKGFKAEMDVLTKRIDDMTKGKGEKGKNKKGKSKKGLIVESFDWDEESVSSEDEGITKIRAFMAIAVDEPSVGKADARSDQWVDITMKKVHMLLFMTDGDERKHVLDYTHVDLHYVEDQRKNLVNKFNLLKQELSLHNSELCNLKNIVSINCSLQNEVIRVNLENESLKDEISDLKRALRGREPLPPLPKLIGATPAGTLDSLIPLSNLTLNMADLTLYTSVPKKTRPSSIKLSLGYAIKRKTENKSPVVSESCTDKKADSSTEQLLLTLMEEVKGLKKKINTLSGTSLSNSQPSSSKSNKQKTWFGPCKHCGLRNHLSDDCYSKPKYSTCCSTDHLTKEHLKHAVVKKTLIKLKAQSPLNPTSKKAPMIPKPFKDCKYYRFNYHHSDNNKYYPWCEVCGSVAHEPTDCPKKHPNNRRPMIANKQSTEPTKKYSKESGLKVVFGDDSSRETEGYGSVNCNRITFTRVAYVNGLKHNLTSISQLCDANFKVLFTKAQGTIFNQNDKIILIAPRIIDVYVIDMSSFNKESNACFFAKASSSVNWLWHKRLSHLNFKKINNLAKHNLVSGLSSLTFSKDKNCSACDCIMSFIRKIKNLNEVRVKELRSDNGTKFRNHKLEEFCDEKVAKAFRVFNIRIQEMKETVHVTFSEDDEAISQSSTEGGAINFNENRSFPDDEFLEPKSKDSISPKEPPEFTNANDHPAFSEHDHFKSSDNLELAEIQDNVIIEPISNTQSSPTTISPSAESILQTHVPQDRWSREKHIELVNIIGEPLAGITTRSRVRDSEAASAHEYLYVNFFSKMEPKKLIEALKEEGWIIATQEELNQFERNKGYNQQEEIDYEETFAPVAAYMGFMVYQMDMKSAFLNRKFLKDVYVQQPLGFESSEFPNHVCKLDKALYGLKQTLRAWYKLTSKKEYLQGCQILGGKLNLLKCKGRQAFMAMSLAEVPYLDIQVPLPFLTIQY